MWTPYLPSLHPTGLTGDVGGPPGELYNGYMDELFPYTSLSGAVTQYRKLYFQNNYGFGLSSCKAYFTDLEHTDQLAMAAASGFETGQADTAPSGASFSTPTGYSAGVPVGNVAYGDYAAIWIRLTLTTGEDFFAHAKIGIGGVN